MGGVLSFIQEHQIDIDLALDAGDGSLLGVLPEVHLVGVVHFFLVLGQPEGVLGQRLQVQQVPGDVGVEVEHGLIAAISFVKAYMDGCVKKVREYPLYCHNLDSLKPKETFESEDFQLKIANFVGKIGRRGRVIVRPSGTEPVIRLTVEMYDNRLDCEKLTSEIFQNKN